MCVCVCVFVCLRARCECMSVLCSAHGKCACWLRVRVHGRCVLALWLHVCAMFCEWDVCTHGWYVLVAWPVQDNKIEYGAAYVRLMYAVSTEEDPFVDVSDPRAYLAHSLWSLSQMAAPGKVLWAAPRWARARLAAACCCCAGPCVVCDCDGKCVFGRGPVAVLALP